MPTDDTALGIYSHRTLWWMFAATTAVCVAIAFGFAPPEWGLLRTVVAGVAVSALSFLSIFVNHLIVW